MDADDFGRARHDPDARRRQTGEDLPKLPLQIENPPTAPMNTNRWIDRFNREPSLLAYRSIRESPFFGSRSCRDERVVVRRKVAAFLEQF